MAHVLGLCIFLGGLATVCESNAFLGRLQPMQDATSMFDDQSENVILAELESALGSGHRHATEKRLKRLEQLLTPMYAAQVKNENGNLGPAAAGYMVHRIFVQRHGWFIRALEPANGSFAAWNTSTPTSVLKDRVPDHVTQLFDRRLGQRGLGLKELALLTATLEHLVHTEALQRLDVAFEGARLSREDTLSDQEVIAVLDHYMAIYILGFMHADLNTMTGEVARELHDNILEPYPTWPETQQFVREVHQSVAPNRDYFYYTDVETIIAEIGERYGRFQDTECRQLKEWLLEVEDTSVGGAGRVRLADFYGKALYDGLWQFSEAVDYLRQLGALDDSDSSNPRVIIPNYISAPSNCVASSAYYSVCCVDECESILGQLEQAIAAPEALPAEIERVISMIASATVPGNRTLAPWLHDRLDEVARHHGGFVPLHGRLFAQWLHYAYPRECQFPHAANTINPQRPEDIIFASPYNFTDTAIFAELSASEDDMQQTIAEAPPAKNRTHGVNAEASEESPMWSLQEELVVSRSIGRQPSMRTRIEVGVRACAFLGAVVSLSVATAQSFAPAFRHGQEVLSEKYLV